jgi:hypothetical protein
MTVLDHLRRVGCKRHRKADGYPVHASPRGFSSCHIDPNEEYALRPVNRGHCGVRRFIRHDGVQILIQEIVVIASMNRMSVNPAAFSGPVR